MNDVVVIGSLNMDCVLEVEHIPAVGETVLGKNMSLIPGGKGANQAYALGRLGTHTEMIGAVGNDAFGKVLVQNLETAGVLTSGIQKMDEVPSGQAFIHVSETGENNITVIQGANQKIGRDWLEIHENNLKACEVLVMQLEIPLDIVVYAAEKAKQYGKLVVLDPAPAVKNLPAKLLANVDVLKPNETELSVLVGRPLQSREDFFEAAEELLQKGVGNVIVTLGGNGVLFVNRERKQFFPSEKVESVDTTAAGDSFTAAFVAALKRTKDGRMNYEEAIRFATKVAGIVVSRKGAQTSIPSLAEVDKLLNKL